MSEEELKAEVKRISEETFFQLDRDEAVLLALKRGVELGAAEARAAVIGEMLEWLHVQSDPTHDSVDAKLRELERSNVQEVKA